MFSWCSVGFYLGSARVLLVFCRVLYMPSSLPPLLVISDENLPSMHQCGSILSSVGESFTVCVSASNRHWQRSDSGGYLPVPAGVQVDHWDLFQGISMRGARGARLPHLISVDKTSPIGFCPHPPPPGFHLPDCLRLSPTRPWPRSRRFREMWGIRTENERCRCGRSFSTNQDLFNRKVQQQQWRDLPSGVTAGVRSLC